MGEKLLPNSVSPSLSLSLSAGPSKVKVKGNPESLCEAGTEQKGHPEMEEKKDSTEKETE